MLLPAVVALLTQSCPALPVPAQVREALRAPDVTARVCTAASKAGRRSGEESSRTRARRVIVREARGLRSVTFTDEHAHQGLGDASGSATERVVFVTSAGRTTWVETNVEQRSETGPFLYQRLTCSITGTETRCRAVDNHGPDGEPGPERVTCGAEAAAKLPTLEGVQRRLELCPELVAP